MGLFSKKDKISATSRILGRKTAGAGAIEELSAAETKTILSLIKSDVGLGSVENYAIASQAEAEAGTVENKYMVPLRVAQAIAIRTNLTASVTSGGVITIEKYGNYEGVELSCEKMQTGTYKITSSSEIFDGGIFLTFHPIGKSSFGKVDFDYYIQSTIILYIGVENVMGGGARAAINHAFRFKLEKIT